MSTSARILKSWGLDRLPSSGDQTLELLHRAYLKHVPFENATKLIAWFRSRRPADARRTPDTFWDDHLRLGAGGTCFAATSAFQWLLDQLGLESRYVFCHLPREKRRAHVALLVFPGDHPHLVDVGYALPAPVPLPRGFAVRRRTPWYDVEIRRGPSGEYLVLTSDSRGPRFRYRFTLDEVSETAYGAAWDATFHEDAAYMTRLTLGCFRPDGRYLYKEPGGLFVIGRNVQRCVPLHRPETSTLSGIFGVSGSILEEARSLLDRGSAPSLTQAAARGRQSPGRPGPNETSASIDARRARPVVRPEPGCLGGSPAIDVLFRRSSGRP